MTVLQRGAREGILTLEIELDDQKALRIIKEKAIRHNDSPCVPFLEKAIRNAYFHSLKPLLQAEVRSNLKEKSDNEALKLFQANLANLLLAPPVGSVPVIGIDPGARPTCRIAVIDENGDYREHATFAPGLPRREQRPGRGHPLPAHPTSRNPCHRYRQWSRVAGNRAFRQEFPDQVSFRAFLRPLSGPPKASQIGVSLQEGREGRRPGGK